LHEKSRSKTYGLNHTTFYWQSFDSLAT